MEIEIKTIDELVEWVRSPDKSWYFACYIAVTVYYDDIVSILISKLNKPSKHDLQIISIINKINKDSYYPDEIDRNNKILNAYRDRK